MLHTGCKCCAQMLGTCAANAKNNLEFATEPGGPFWISKSIISFLITYYC